MWQRSGDGLPSAAAGQCRCAASEDPPRSHSRFEIQISTRLSFPSFETAIQKEPSAPFWHKPAWPLIKIGWIRLDSVGLGLILKWVRLAKITFETAILPAFKSGRGRFFKELLTGV
jgi:hypothetical protein